MLQIQNGKIKLDGAAFSLPEGFFIESVNENSCAFRLGGILLQIGVEESPFGVERILLDGVGDNQDYLLASELLCVSRGDKQGKALFACANGSNARYYEERFALANGKQLFIVVEGHNENLLSQKEIQDFLNGVE